MLFLLAVSETCVTLKNIAQYANFALSNATGESSDCFTSSPLCNGITCTVGREMSSLSFTLVPCSVPPSLNTVLTSPNGTVEYNGTITDSQTLTWDVFSAVRQINIVVQHYNATTIGLEVGITIKLMAS